MQINLNLPPRIDLWCLLLQLHYSKHGLQLTLQAVPLRQQIHKLYQLSYRLRAALILFTYQTTSGFYIKHFKKKKKAWGLTVADYQAFPKNSLGQRLHNFYQETGFTPMPKQESHDVYHLISGIGTQVEDEVALQYFLLGNGKRSIYLLLTVLFGGLIFPEFLAYFKQCIRQGKNTKTVHKTDYYPLLNQDFSKLLNP